MLKLTVLIECLEAIRNEHGNIPVMLSINAMNDGDEILVHSDVNGVSAEVDHDTEGKFARISGDATE